MFLIYFELYTILRIADEINDGSRLVSLLLVATVWAEKWRNDGGISGRGTKYCFPRKDRTDSIPFLTICVPEIPYILESNPHSVFGDFLNEKKLVRRFNSHLSFNRPLPTGWLIE